MTTLLADALRDPELKKYLPDLIGKQTINRQFLFNIINTIKPNFFPFNIRGIMEAKKEQQAAKNQTFIEV